MMPKEMYRLVFFDKESKEIEILPLGKETKENFKPSVTKWTQNFDVQYIIVK